MALGTFGKSLVVFSTKLNLLYLLFSTAQRCCLLHLQMLYQDKAKLFAKIYSKKFNLDDSGISLPVFPSKLIWNCIKILKFPRWSKGKLSCEDYPRTMAQCMPLKCEVSLTSNELEEATFITIWPLFLYLYGLGGNITHRSYYWSTSHMTYVR